MKKSFINTRSTNNLAKLGVSALFGVLLVTGCGGNNAEAPAEGTATTSENPAAPAATKIATGKPKGTVKIGDKIICAICHVKEGKQYAEVVQATLDYKGKTYGFCNKAEEAEFINEPTKYADAS